MELVLKKFFVGFLWLLGIRSRPKGFFTVKILNWDNDCTQEKALKMEGYLLRIAGYLNKVKGYENRLRVFSVVDWVDKEIYVHVLTSNDPNIKKSFLTLEDVHCVEEQLLKILEEMGYKALISKESINNFYGDL